MKKIAFLFLVVFLVSSCASYTKCDCEIPGPALVKVFMDVDGKPNVNIEKLSTYPGEVVIFEGLPEFELVFNRDPGNPNGKTKKYSSKKGVIKLRISKEYKEVLASLEKTEDRDQDESRSVKAVIIKYDIHAQGEKRDPKIRIIEH